jgi:zinc protease
VDGVGSHGVPAAGADRERFETQRDVVLNERRQNYENRPYGMALMALSAALFRHASVSLADHRRRDDIRAMEFEDVRRSSAPTTIPPTPRWRSPATSTRSRRSSWRRNISATSPAGTKPQPVEAEASLPREIRLVLEDRVELPRLLHGLAFAGDVR